MYESVCDKPTDPKNLQLLDDVAHHRVAGVVMTWEGSEFSDSPLYDPSCDVPRVALHPTPASSGVPSVVIDWEAFFDRAVERLAAMGRRKIACIVIGADGADNTDALDALKRRGLEYRRYWHLNVGPFCYAAARTATHLMMSLAPADRPDGLIIADDNLVDHAQAGLIDARVQAPEDLRRDRPLQLARTARGDFPAHAAGLRHHRAAAHLRRPDRPAARGRTPPERRPGRTCV